MIMLTLEKNNNELKLDDFMNMASSETGLSDWGEKDFIPSLECLINSFYSQEQELARHIFFRNECLRLLKNRLYIQHNLAKYPQIKKRTIQKPIFIIGLGRTGSTLLHNLLSLSPVFRTLKYWELLYPSPVDIYLTDNDNRIIVTQKQIKAMYRRFPELLNKHELQAERPEECCLLMMHTFLSRHFYISWNVPAYADWLNQQDLKNTYQYYKDLLCLLTHKEEPLNLVLKDPMHLPSLNHLLSSFPDARFIWTHRDPATVISSYYSLSKSIKGSLSKKEMILGIEQLAKDTRDADIVRHKNNESKFFDVPYNDLVFKTEDVIKNIFRFLEVEYDDHLIEKITQWKAENRQDKFGRHHHTLDSLGLNQDQIYQIFSYYHEKYSALYSI